MSAATGPAASGAEHAVRVLAVRHGQARPTSGASGASGPYEDSVLTPLGQEQARATAAALERSAPDALYTSPMPRAEATATAIGATLGLQPVVDDQLRQFTFAEPLTMPIEQAAALRADLLYWRANDRLGEQAETLWELAQRVVTFMYDLTQRHVGATAVVVTHDGVIDAMIRWAIGMGPGSDWMHEFPLANCSITELLYWPQPRVPDGAPHYAQFLRVGSVDHLAPEARSEY